MKIFGVVSLFIASAVFSQDLHAHNITVIFSCNEVIKNDRTTKKNNPIEMTLTQKLGKPMSSDISYDGDHYKGSGEYQISGMILYASNGETWRTILATWSLLKGKKGKFYKMSKGGSKASSEHICTPVGSQG